MKDWDDLRFFGAVAEAGSLSAGAQMLGVNASTVSRRIASLEERLAVRLFDRAGKRYLLTEHGRLVYKQLGNVSDLINEIEQRIFGMDSQMSGLIRITCPLTVANWFMTGAVQAFRDLYPEITCDILVSAESYDLTKREADIAFRATNTPPEVLIGRKLGVTQWAFYASLKNAQKIEIDKNEVKGIIAPTGLLKDVPAYQWLLDHLNNYEVVAATDEMITMVEMARQHIGIALLPGEAAADLIEVGKPGEAMQTDLWLLTHPDLRGNVRVQTCMKFLSDRYKEVTAQGR